MFCTVNSVEVETKLTVLYLNAVWRRKNTLVALSTLGNETEGLEPNKPEDFLLMWECLFSNLAGCSGRGLI